MRRQQGFTLVEIAVVLVVVGLLLGGVLKGRELITTARIHSLAQQQRQLASAYRAFVDRYGAVPGDMASDTARRALGEPIETGGDADGRLQAPSDGWGELNAVWEHLSKAGFIEGRFEGREGGPPGADGRVSPRNAFDAPVVLAHHEGYLGAGAARLVLHLGQRVPPAVARALDQRVDDGSPVRGRLRSAAMHAEPGPHEAGPECVDRSGAEALWNTAREAANCNPTLLW